MKPETTSDDAIHLESCSELEWIAVETRTSLYDVVVLSGKVGDVMVRGGRFFPRLRRATIAGSSFGGTAVKSRTICVGLHLEFCADGTSFVTSRIQAVSRHREHRPYFGSTRMCVPARSQYAKWPASKKATVLRTYMGRYRRYTSSPVSARST